MHKSLRRIPDMRIVLAMDNDTAKAFTDYIEPRYHYNSNEKFYEIIATSSGQEALALFPPLATIVLGENLSDMTRQEFLLKLGDKVNPARAAWFDFIFVNEKDILNEPIPAFVERYWNVHKPLSLRECFLNQFVANFNIRRMLAM